MKASKVTVVANGLKGIREQTVSALAKVLAVLKPEDQGSGIHMRIFMLMEGVGGPKDLAEILEVWIYGKTNHKEARQFRIFSFEKALRLAIYFKRNHNIRSAYQANRNRDEDRYAGAVLVRCNVPGFGLVWLIVSVSGLGEMSDEAVALLVAKSLPWAVDVRDIGDIVRASKNEMAKYLLAA